MPATFRKLTIRNYEFGRTLTFTIVPNSYKGWNKTAECSKLLELLYNSDKEKIVVIHVLTKSVGAVQGIYVNGVRHDGSIRGFINSFSLSSSHRWCETVYGHDVLCPISDFLSSGCTQDHDITVLYNETGDL